MEIEKQNLIIGQNTGLFAKDELKKNKQTSKSAGRSGLKSLFSSMLSDSVNEESPDVSQTDNIWTDNYMEDNVRQSLDEIGELGRKIKRSLSYDDVVEYKTLVQNYLQNVIDRSEKISEIKGFSHFRRRSVDKTVIEIIDKELLELTRAFMQTQIPVMKVAASVDKIYGLLADMFVG